MFSYHKLTRAPSELDLSKDRVRIQDGIDQLLAGLPLENLGQSNVDILRERLKDLYAKKLTVSQEHEALQNVQLELEAEAKKYRELYDGAPISYWTISSDGTVVQTNAAAEKMMGAGPGTLTGRLFSEFVITADKCKLDDFFRGLVQTQESAACDLPMRKPDGSPMEAHLVGAAWKGHSGEFLFQAVVIDITQRKKAESELRQNQKKLNDILDATLDGVWEWHIPSGKVYFSDQWCRLLGYERHEVPDRVDFFYVILHPEDFGRVNKAIKDHLEGKTPTKQDEVRLKHRDGGYRWFFDRGKVVETDEQGNPIRMVGTITDISDRKKAEDALIESERELRLIANNMPGPVSRMDRELRFLFVNDPYELFFGRRRAEVVGRTMHEVMSTEAIKSIQPYIDKALAGERVTPEISVTRFDGSRRILLLNFVPELNSDHETVGFFMIAFDITDRKHIEIELQGISEKLEQAQALARTGNWTYDVETASTYWSKQMFALFEVPVSNGPIGYPTIVELFHPLDAGLVDESFKNTIVSGTPYSIVVRLKQHQNGVSFVRCEGRARRNQLGEVAELYGTVTDVTQEIEREEALRVARQQAEAANHSKSEFLANMSHEIRTPLTAILGFADLLRDEYEADVPKSDRIRTIDTIVNAGTHLLTIINDILDLSKIEANKFTVERIDTQLVEMLQEIEGIMRSQANGKGVTLGVSLANAVPDKILSDPTRLRQILLNLVGNAVKFTEAGSIHVTAAVNVVSELQQLTIDVEDTGRGMASEQLKHLFHPFAQADNTVTRMYGGTGLGLHISRRLASLLGGDVSLVRSELGKGSCFRLTIPLEASPNAVWVDYIHPANTLPDGALGPATTQLSGRVLLAEDGKDNQKLIAFHLKKAGATVSIADNGLVALEMIEQGNQAGTPYDLLITDIQMPEMDGYALVHILRSRGEDIPIIALTAHALSEDRMKCLAVGCNDYESKPIAKSTLLEKCAKWLIPRS